MLAFSTLDYKLAPCSDATIIPFEPPLPQVLPTIEGNVDYRHLREQLLRIDELLVLSGLETQSDAKGSATLAGPAQKSQRQGPAKPSTPLLPGIALQYRPLLLQEDFRGFATRLADSPLLQFFCGISRVDSGDASPPKAPSNAMNSGGPSRRCAR